LVLLKSLLSTTCRCNLIFEKNGIKEAGSILEIRIFGEIDYVRAFNEQAITIEWANNAISALDDNTLPEKLSKDVCLLYRNRSVHMAFKCYHGRCWK